VEECSSFIQQERKLLRLGKKKRLRSKKLDENIRGIKGCE